MIADSVAPGGVVAHAAGAPEEDLSLLDVEVVRVVPLYDWH